MSENCEIICPLPFDYGDNVFSVMTASGKLLFIGSCDDCVDYIVEYEKEHSTCCRSLFCDGSINEFCHVFRKDKLK